MSTGRCLARWFDKVCEIFERPLALGQSDLVSCALIAYSIHSLSHSACFEPCYLSWTNTVSCGKRPADLRVVPKSKHDNFLRGKLVTSSKRSLGYPSFCTSRTSSCKKKKIINTTPYNIFYTRTKVKDN